jgi:sterol desaturase/sphingolipid hydroxylase (fatty acid hydroxylase superfamily)
VRACAIAAIRVDEMEIFGFTESTLRLSAFLAIFGSMALFELLSPRLERPEFVGALKSKRWLTNIAMVVLSSVVLRVVFPAAAVGIAIWAGQAGFGFFNWLSTTIWLAALLCFVALDFAVWLEHVMSHKWKWLWRIHRVHHSDTGFDVTTALRFHPLEIIISMLWKGAIVALLGAPALLVLVFEIVLNGSAMFNHANIKLPLAVDRFIRLAIVTPDMHRVHHSQDVTETNSNYGFNFSFWDRLFGTYTAEPRTGMNNLNIGLAEFNRSAASRFDWALKLPFLK